MGQKRKRWIRIRNDHVALPNFGGVDFGGNPKVQRAILTRHRCHRSFKNCFANFGTQAMRRTGPHLKWDPTTPAHAAAERSTRSAAALRRTLNAGSVCAIAAMRRVMPPTYQPIAAHGYGPQQFEEMVRYAWRHSS